MNFESIEVQRCPKVCDIPAVFLARDVRFEVAPTPPPCSVYDKACEAAAAGISAKAAQDGYRKWFDNTADWLREEQKKFARGLLGAKGRHAKRLRQHS